MSRSDWLLGDFDGNRYISMKSLYGREVVKMLDYVIVDGVKFVSADKLHDERVRELEFTTCKCGEEVERPVSVCPSCGRRVGE